VKLRFFKINLRLAGSGVNQAAGRILPAGHQLVIAGLDNRLTNGSKVVSHTHWPHFTPQKHYYFYVSGIQLLEAE
jgi:hypothetical protein